MCFLSKYLASKETRPLILDFIIGPIYSYNSPTLVQKYNYQLFFSQTEKFQAILKLLAYYKLYSLCSFFWIVKKSCEKKTLRWYLTLNSRAPCRTFIGRGGGVHSLPSIISAPIIATGLKKIVPCLIMNFWANFRFLHPFS